MGNDGSSIVRVKNLQVSLDHLPNKTRDKEAKNFDAVSRWTVCRLTGQPLRLPVVSDYLGNLLNKESILEWLLTPDKEDYSEEQIRLFGHIRSLKDVVELGNLVVDKDSRLKCDVGDEILGKSSSKLSYPAICGHVFPRRMLDNATEQPKCPVCDKPISKSDTITLNAESTDRDALEKRMIRLKRSNLTHSGKRSKSKKREAPAIGNSNTKRQRN
ncbi:Peptidyl-prolyl cis-trans isomerase-like 2 [Lachancea thermotolerans]|uniref:KLTH0E16280p n=1 Tax=Lachancea thermotolerans (strain ATCC 56472 / CBS 6340 / NRRL Y-8284) TaxID=559295 RepID=C5DIZ0_LACTC|nr:KLTH0E16280p [Lachancea thermotolerans CBS 6340]CAR23751.1 KLTH0E16280p [Lachancea thermotolerans CBS 6340]